jgi:putative nucleotidyltransferase with HDIG domain
MIPEPLLDRIRVLEPLPASVQALLPILLEQETPVREVTELLELDQEVASRLMEVLNSRLYAGRYPLEDLEVAVTRLGAGTVLDALLSDHIRTLPMDAPLYGLKADETWLHAAISSLAVVEVLRENPRKEIPRIASTAALLHDIGKVVMVQEFGVQTGAVTELCRNEDLTFARAEALLFGCHHAEVGAAMVRKWGLPENAAEAIEYHHEAPLPDATALMDAVALANLVAKTVGVGLGSEGMNFQIDSGSYVRLGLDFNSFCRICARVGSALEDVKGIPFRAAIH